MRGMSERTPKAQEAQDWHLKLFSLSFMKQAKLRQIAAMMGSTGGQACLDLGGDNGVISYQLRRRGGTWTSADLGEKSVASIRRLVGERVERVEGSKLPFPDRSFDVIVIIDMLEHVADDAQFIAECHRVLKQSGRLVVNVPHVKSWSILRPIRRLLGLTDEAHGHLRPGYTQSQLFELLKDGFNVEAVQTYSRFFSEALDTAIRYVATRMSKGGAGESDPKGLMIDEQDFARMKKMLRIYTFLYPFFWLAAQLDLLLFFTRGYSLVAKAKWRPWIPRRTPVLRDGRSIAEAALGGKIGTAAPF